MSKEDKENLQNQAETNKKTILYLSRNKVKKEGRRMNQ